MIFASLSESSSPFTCIRRLFAVGHRQRLPFLEPARLNGGSGDMVLQDFPKSAHVLWLDQVLHGAFGQLRKRVIRRSEYGERARRGDRSDIVRGLQCSDQRRVIFRADGNTDDVVLVQRRNVGRLLAATASSAGAASAGACLLLLAAGDHEPSDEPSDDQDSHKIFHYNLPAGNASKRVRSIDARFPSRNSKSTVSRRRANHAWQANLANFFLVAGVCSPCG